MAVAYKGAGTYAAGNNASVTPGLPSGLAAGDFLVLHTAIREPTATINTPSGWTRVSDGQNTNAIHTIATFYRFWQSGDAAPTVTFSGGGSNDTTQAQIVAYTGVRSSTPMVRQANQFGVSYASQAYFYDTSIAIGDMLSMQYAIPNDESLLAYSTVQMPGFISIPGGTVGSVSALGADAAQHVIYAAATVVYTGGSTYNYLLASSSTQGVFDSFVIYQAVTGQTFSHTGSGGLKLGGSALASLRSTVLRVTGAGGLKFGGAADAIVRYPVLTVVPTGGLMFGGEADAYLRQSVLPVTGSGGVVFGGAADAILIAPTAYHIDFINGSDSNNGATWGTAFKTFWPVAARVVPVAAGDVIKIAKTPEPVNRGSRANSVLVSSTADGSGTSGFEGGTNINLVAFNSAITVIDPMDSLTGWVFPNGANGTFSSVSINTPYNAATMLEYYDSTYVANFKFAYKAMAATLDLSSKGRIEFGLTGYVDALSVTSQSQQLTLCLCSDATGDVSLLEIPFRLTDTYGGVFSYEGALPAGVNSISFKTTSADMICRLYFMSLIATHPLSSTDYLGLYSEMRIGDHESSFWIPIIKYTASGGNVFAMVNPMTVGPASLHNTTMQVYTRTVWGWSSLRPGSARIQGQQSDVPGPSYALTDVLSPAYGYKPTFDLSSLQGTVTTPIQIIGGYDTGTNAVTGKTALLVRSGFYNKDMLCHHIALLDTRHVTMKNIDLLSIRMASWVFAGDNRNLRYENCEIVHVDNGNGSEYSGAVALNDNSTQTGVHAIDGIHFKSCKGVLYLQSIFPVNQARFLIDGSWEDSVLTPYLNAAPAYPIYSTFFPTTTMQVVGSLKIYCSGFQMSGASARHYLPNFGDSPDATVYAYASGSMLIPVCVPPGRVAQRVLPSFDMENAQPCFSFPNLSVGTADRIGACDFVRVPSLTLRNSSTSWCTRATSSPTLYRYNYLITTFDHGAPPLHIENLTHIGAPLTTSGQSVVPIIHGSHGSAVQVSNATMSTSYRYLLHAKNATVDHTSDRIPLGAYGPEIAIYDGANWGSILAGSQMTLLQGLVRGILDVRNVTAANTNSSYYEIIGASAPVYAAGPIRFVGCAITNTNAPATSMVQAYPAIASFAAQTSVAYGGPLDSGLVFEDCVLPLSTTITAENVGTNYGDYFSSGIPVQQWTRAFTVINATTPSHAVYSPDVQLKKDFTNTYGGSFSWKSWSNQRRLHPFSGIVPLGSVPAKVGATMTISLAVRRSTATNCFAGLLVSHNGCAGNATPQDLLEIVELTTAAANTWQVVEIDFIVARSGMVDLNFTHFGVELSTAWFADLRVVES